VTIRHESAGTGPLVVLLHSSVCDRRMWAPQLPALADAGYRAVAVDFRGFGDTPPARGHSDAQDVHDLLDYLGEPRAALVGASFGGRIAQEVAYRWPDRVTNLALLCAGSPGATPGPDLVAVAEREDALVAAGDLAGVLDLAVATWLGPAADETARAAVRAMRGRSLEVQVAFGAEAGSASAPGDLADITARTLVVSGAHDLPHFRALAVRIAAAVPDSRHLDLPWAGHLPALERPAEITGLLLDHLAG
jgi:pimeloyl-ACP methyl ester carboxylesterase